jgi:hypothetical protein
VPSYGAQVQTNAGKEKVFQFVRIKSVEILTAIRDVYFKEGWDDFARTFSEPKAQDKGMCLSKRGFSVGSVSILRGFALTHIHIGGDGREGPCDRFLAIGPDKNDFMDMFDDDSPPDRITDYPDELNRLLSSDQELVTRNKRCNVYSVFQEYGCPIVRLPLACLNEEDDNQSEQNPLYWDADEDEYALTLVFQLSSYSTKASPDAVIPKVHVKKDATPVKPAPWQNCAFPNALLLPYGAPEAPYGSSAHVQ